MPVKVPATADAPETWQVVWDAAAGAKSFGIPYSFFIFVLITLTAIVFLNLTVWGRHMQAVGRNEEAARYSGISTNRVTILAYVLCAVLTGIGGVMFAIDSNSIAPSSFGNFFELYAIAAAVLGGCSLRGGEGSILGVVVGTALMQTLYNSIVLLKIPDELEFTIIGAVILFGVIADELMRRLAGRFR
jgi:ribose transport system permease protein